MLDLYKYRNALGVPGEGIHAYRVLNIAIADVVMTFIGAFFLSFIFKTSYWFTLISLFILGIILHRLFFVKTTIDKLIFPNAP